MSEYLSRPLLDVRPDFKRLTAGQLDDFTFQTIGMGKATPWKVTSGPKRTVSMEFLFGTHPEQKTFRQFFGDLKGRRYGFWLPIWLNEYSIVEDASMSATEITVRRAELADSLADFENFRHLVLCTWDKIECYEIDSVAEDGDNEVITLTSGLTTALVANDTVCGGLLFARLAGDTIKYTHKNDIVSRVNVQFTELPAEYTTEHEGSAPIYLYKFTKGLDNWRFGNWGMNVTAGGNTWERANVTHTNIRAGIDVLSDQIQIRFGTDQTYPTNPLRYFNNRLTAEDMTVTVYKTDLSTLTVDTTAPLFVGKVERVQFEDKGIIVAQVSSIFRVGEVPLPQKAVQRLCNNRLFDGVCSLVAATYTTAGTISAQSTTIVLPYVEATAFGTKATTEDDPNWFALGKVTVGTEVRLCVGQDGNRLYLDAPFAGADIAEAVSATAGCDKRIGTCELKFGNLDNYLGFPYIPSVDPNLEALVTPRPSGGKKG
jgi:hypothetical protein